MDHRVTTLRTRSWVWWVSWKKILFLIGVQKDNGLDSPTAGLGP